MKLFFLTLFAMSTITTALHALGHIHAHDTSTCQVCIVDDHTNSFDVINTPTPVDILSSEDNYLFTCKNAKTVFQHFSHYRAPPLS